MLQHMFLMQEIYTATLINEATEAMASSDSFVLLVFSLKLLVLHHLRKQSQFFLLRILSKCVTFWCIDSKE